MKIFDAKVSIHVDEIPNDVLFAEWVKRINGRKRVLNKAGKVRGGGSTIRPQTAAKYRNYFKQIYNAINYKS